MNAACALLGRVKNSVLGLQSTKIFNGNYPDTFLTFQRRWNRLQSVPMFVYDDALNDFVEPSMPPPSTPEVPSQGGNLWARALGRFWNSPSPPPPSPHQDIPRHQEHFRQEPARSMVSGRIAPSGFTPKADDVYVK